MRQNNIQFLSKTGCHIHTIYVRTNIEILMKMISLKSLKSLQYEIATVFNFMTCDSMVCVQDNLCTNLIWQFLIS